MNFPKKKKKAVQSIIVVIVCIAFFILFFYEYFANIEICILSGTEYNEWTSLVINYYTNIEHQIFELKQFPHFYPYIMFHAPYNALFANPEVAVLTPVTLALPFSSQLGFFIFHFSFHALIALIGVMLLRKRLNLPHFSVLIMFVLTCMNGRLLANYFVGHTVFITVTWIPLLFYFYIPIWKRQKPGFGDCVGMAVVLAMMFFEGGIHPLIWFSLFLIFDVSLVVLGEAIDAVGAIKKKRELIESIKGMIKKSMPMIKYIAIIIVLALLIVAIKLLPVLVIKNWVAYSPEAQNWPRFEGYKTITFFSETFYQHGLGKVLRQKELWFEEGYNFIGVAGFVLLIFSLGYSVFINKDRNIKRLALVMLMFILLSFGKVYAFIFQHIPIFQGERVPSRMIFTVIEFLPILIAVSLNSFLIRFKADYKLRDSVMLSIGGIIFFELFLEFKRWMWARVFQPLLELNVKVDENINWLIGPDYLPAKEMSYMLLFRIGLIVSILTVLGLIIVHIINSTKKRKKKTENQRRDKRKSQGHKRK